MLSFNNLSCVPLRFSDGHEGPKVDTTGPRSRPEARYLWFLATDRLIFALTFGRNRHSQRFLRGDIEYLRAWLKEPTLSMTLAALFGGSHDEAVDLVMSHRDHMAAAGYAVATINRHLCTLRAAARIAREMGQIDWDLSDVTGIAICDNRQVVKGFTVGQVGAEGREGRNLAAQPLSTTAPEEEEEKGCY
jgi:hypothetical protein